MKNIFFFGLSCVCTLLSVHNDCVVCNQHGTKISKRVCVCSVSELASLSHNQGVSTTHKHKIDFNGVGVNFPLEGLGVRIEGQRQTLLIQTVGGKPARAACA